MNRLLCAALAFACLAACAPPKAETERDLGELVVDYLKDKDFDGFYEDLVVTESELSGLCPALVSAYELEKSTFQPGFDRCTKWAFEPGDMLTRPGKTDCGGATKYLRDIEFGTGTPYGGVWSIHGAIETEQGWKVLGELDCPGE